MSSNFKPFGKPVKHGHFQIQEERTTGTRIRWRVSAVCGAGPHLLLTESMLFDLAELLDDVADAVEDRR